MKLTSAVDSFGDKFTITTTTRLLFFTLPHSTVIPLLVDGSMTPERGFQVYYSTTDEEILQEWHNRLRQKAELGGYWEMVAMVRCNHPPILDMRLAQYVTGFKY